MAPDRRDRARHDDLATSHRVARDPVFLLLASFALLQAAWVGSRLWVRDLNLHYPFPGGDGFDWIANALALSGAPVRYTGRPPLFALLLAVLHRFDAAGLLPFLQQLALAAVALIAYASLRGRQGRLVAAIVALCVLTNETLLRQGLDIMAEPLVAALLAGAIAAFIGARARPRLYFVAGLLDGLAMLTQPLSGLVLPAAAVTMLWRRRADLRRREPWLGVAVAVLLPGSWAVARPLWMGAYGDHAIRGLGLVRVQLDGLSFYTDAALTLAGLPLLALVTFAMARAVGRWRSRLAARRSATTATGPPGSPPPDDDALLFTGLLACALSVFFLVLYDFRAGRFLVYPLVPALWWVAAGLAAIRSTLLRALAGVATVWFVAWPTPGFDAHPWVDVARFAARGDHFDTIDPALFPDAPSIVYIERPDGEELRWRPIYRLGNALRRRVKVAPPALYPNDWWGWHCLGQDLEADEYVLAHWSCPGTPVSAVMAWSRRLPPKVAARQRNARAVATGASRPAFPFPVDEAADWDRARHLAAEVERDDGFLVAHLGRGPATAWLRALPFVARTTGLVITPRRGLGSGLREELEHQPTLAEWDAAGCRLRRTRLRRYGVLEIVSCSAD